MLHVKNWIVIRQIENIDAQQERSLRDAEGDRPSINMLTNIFLNFDCSCGKVRKRKLR